MLTTDDDKFSLFFNKGSSNLEFKFTTLEGSNPRPNINEGDFSTNVFNNLVAMYNGTNLSLWLNGNFISSVTRDGTSFISNNNWWTVSSSSNYRWNGSIDNLNFAGRALTPTEIQEIYNVGILRSNYSFTEDVIASYKFNENNGTTTHDSKNEYFANIEGASWENDDVEVNLTEDTDFSISGSILTLLNSIYNWNWLNLTYQSDEEAPVITLVSPTNNTGDNDGNVILNYNVTDNFDIANCSLILNGIINRTNSSITKDTVQNFTLEGLAFGLYNWSINCTDINNNLGSSETRIFSVLNTTDFSGNTTDLTLVNISNITNLIINQPNYGKINFSEIVDLSSGGDINSYVNISDNRIEINSTALPSLNKSARLRLYNLTFTNPRILKDSVVCSDCTEVSYSRGTFVFDVTSFSVYSAKETPTSTTVTISPSSGGGYPTYKPTQEQLEEGYKQSLRKNYKMKFNVSNKSHELKVDDVGDKMVTITISSESQTFDLGVNETKKLDLDSDGFYDLEVFLRSISGFSYWRKANLVVRLVRAEVSSEEITEEEQNFQEVEIVEEKSNLWLWVVVGLVAILVLTIIVLCVKQRKKT